MMERGSKGGKKEGTKGGWENRRQHRRETQGDIGRGRRLQETKRQGLAIIMRTYAPLMYKDVSSEH